MIDERNGWDITDYGVGEYDRMGPLLCCVGRKQTSARMAEAVEAAWGPYE